VRLLPPSLCLFSAVLLACNPPAPTSPTYYRDVQPLIDKSCAGCHATGGIAPFALETIEQVKQHAVAISAAVQSRRMPPWMPGDGCGQPFVDDFHLEPAEIETIVKWAEAPVEGDVADMAAKTAKPTLQRVDALLEMGASYTPSATLTDDYRCFVIDPAVAGTKFVTGYNILPGSAAVVHHVILYMVDRAKAKAADDAAAGPGWPCFGGAEVDTEGTLGAWAPGGGAVRFPGGTGLALEPNIVIAMQIHYNTRSGTEPDLTRAELQFAERPVTAAALIPIAAAGFRIPPRTMGHTYSERFPNELGLDAEVWGLLPHMHTRGKSITMRSDTECLISIPKWDFHWQRAYFRPRPAPISQSSGLTMECVWDNPTDDTLTWGERTSDEMCFAYIYATLK